MDNEWLNDYDKTTAALERDRGTDRAGARDPALEDVFRGRLDPGRKHKREERPEVACGRGADSHCSEADLPTESPLVRLKPGEYVADVVAYRIRPPFRMERKLELWFRVGNDYVVRYYCINGSGAGYSAGPRSNLTRELARVLGRIPDYSADPIGAILGQRLIVNIRTVTRDRYGRELPDELQYSVVGPVLCRE